MVKYCVISHNIKFQNFTQSQYTLQLMVHYIIIFIRNSKGYVQEMSTIQVAYRVSISCLMTGAVYIMKYVYHFCGN